MSDTPRVTSARPNAGSPAARPTGKGSKKSRRDTGPVKKPTPWASIALFSALALFAGGIIAYAATNAGEARLDPSEIVVADVETFKDLKKSHVDGEVSYEQKPAVGGDHDGTPQDCQGRVYGAPIREENAVHSLEHGATWVTYDPELPKGQVEDLTKLVDRELYRMMSPYPGQDAPIKVSAWGLQMEAESADDPRIKDFLKKYTNGEQTQEPGASCAGVQTTEG